MFTQFTYHGAYHGLTFDLGYVEFHAPALNSSFLYTKLQVEKWKHGVLQHDRFVPTKVFPI